ncbi:MAG: S53 family peptidase [Terracidiphilus sp.]|jgi:subtilase family serine protease
MRQRIRAVSCLASALLIASCGGNPRVESSQAYASLPATNIANPIDESRMVTLHGNVHPLARAEFDQGAVNPATRLDRMLLILNSSPAQSADLDALLAAQQEPDSPLYHKWLAAAEFGSRFGASDADLVQVSAWLELHGFTIDEIPAGRRLVVFSGSAAQVSAAFRTGLHIYRVNGTDHLANVSDPQIPATLSGLVAGVVSLHDFRRISEMRTRTPLAAQPDYSAGATHYLFPADFATIYDLNPLFAAGTNGTGSSIAIAARSNIRLSDVESFRSMAALPPNDPTVTLAGADPGLVDHDQDESTLDAEWSGAAAPAASVNLVVAATTATTDGVDLASAWIVNHAAASVVSVSYGSCEQEMGATELAFYNSLWEQAASQGMSVFVASGDAGAAGCSAATANTGSANAVNGLCSSAYSTCVGGTKFNEGSNAAQYWSAANSSAYASALGYIPEEVWNESASNGGTGLWASGGGASVVYPQPGWQAGVDGAAAANGMRAVPDISLSAADHDGYFVVENGSFWIASGTSASAPSFAGIMALVAESQHGAPQGNANPRLYTLANSTDDPFHPTPSGDNTVPGVAGFTATGATYNLATGLGSVDASLLVNNWSSLSNPPTLALTAAAQSVAVSQGGSATLEFTAATGGSFAGAVTFSVSGLPAGIAAAWSANPVIASASSGTNHATLTLTAAQGSAIGYFPLVVSAAGDGLTSEQTVTLLVQPHSIACSRFGLLPTRCAPLPRMPIPLAGPPHNSASVRSR